jgi:hypothetical protein
MSDRAALFARFLEIRRSVFKEAAEARRLSEARAATIGATARSGAQLEGTEAQSLTRAFADRHPIRRHVR